MGVLVLRWEKALRRQASGVKASSVGWEESRIEQVTDRANRRKANLKRWQQRTSEERGGWRDMRRCLKECHCGKESMSLGTERQGGKKL